MENLLKSLQRFSVSTSGQYSIFRRGGYIRLAFPRRRDAALRTLALYQAQSTKARMMMKALNWLIRCNLHWLILPRISFNEPPLDSAEPALDMIPETIGVMFGNPEHKIKRAIVSSQNRSHQWEVTKVAFGPDGWNVVGAEAEILQLLPPNLPGKPEVLGTFRDRELSWIRLPYIKGQILDQSSFDGVLDLLDSWLSTTIPKKNIQSFPEWQVLQQTLASSPRGLKALHKLEQIALIPSVSHGDFARWNLLRLDSGKLIVLDWEWANPEGMPGFDLVHYFAQDARLVSKLSPDAVVTSVIDSLSQPDCQKFLKRCGWDLDPLLLLIANIAYTFGSVQQVNGDILEAALSRSTAS